MKFDSSQTDPEEVQQLRDSLLAGQGADSVSPSGVGDIAAVDPVGDDQSRAGAADRREPPYVDAGAPQVDDAAGAHAAIDSGPVAPGSQSFEAGPPTGRRSCCQRQARRLARRRTARAEIGGGHRPVAGVESVAQWPAGRSRCRHPRPPRPCPVGPSRPG